MATRNQEVIGALEDLLTLTILDEGGPQSFRVRAYENAVRELGEVSEELAEMSESQLTKIDGVGKSTAKKIREYFTSGHIAKLETLRDKYPPEFVELSRIPGLGPKSLLFLRDELGVDTIDKLKEAIASETIRDLKGFGKKSEEKIAQALARTDSSGKNARRAIAEVLPLADHLVARLLAMPDVEKATYCGSLRRFRPTIADIDIVVVSGSADIVFDALLASDDLGEVLGRGETKMSALTQDGLQIDVRIVTLDQYGAAILYFTGSKAHNIKLRQRALAFGWTLNEYALSDVSSGDTIASRSEEDIYAALELEFVPPPMREDHGEVEAAATKLPRYLTAEQVSKELGPNLRELALIDLGSMEDAGREKNTQRAIEALEQASTHAVVNIWGTTTLDVDWHAVAKVSAASQTAIGIDARLEVLQPAADILRSIAKHGALFAVSVSDLGDLNESQIAHAVSLCQRGWLEADSVINTWPATRLAKWKDLREA
jgi:DNA polymerase (family 10)